MQQLEFFTAFIYPLEQHQIPYFITGSIASIFYGEPRLTHDIDIVIHLNPSNIQRLNALFPLEQYYCPPEEVIHIEARRKPYGHLNLIHHKTGLKADLYTDAGDALHEWAFKMRKRITLGENLELWLAPPEYVIIRKLEYFREGGSTKHLEDIQKMLSQVHEVLDQDFLQKQIDNRRLEVCWQKIKKP